MTVDRNRIENALNELVTYEEGVRFQSLAVVLAKQKWPDLIASERKWDLGLDAYARPSVATDGKGKALACSITATVEKISKDAERIKDKFTDIAVLIFYTPQKVTNHTAASWADEIKKTFGYDLVVVSREDIITSLMDPANLVLCRTHLRIEVPLDESTDVLLNNIDGHYELFDKSIVRRQFLEGIVASFALPHGQTVPEVRGLRLSSSARRAERG